MTTTSLHCPRSGHPLVRLRIGGVDTDVCEHCGGVWLDRFEVSRFEAAGNVFGDALMAHLAQVPAALIEPTVRLRCPRHPDTVMIRRAFSRTIPVQIDECPQCGGHWLDAGELAQIRR